MARRSGSTFHGSKDRPVSGRATSSSLSPTGTETILLVEDEPGVRRLSRTILEAQGYAVLEAASGDEALEVARSHPGEIHLVATDVIMPGISGRVLWDRLRGLRPDSRVLFMSGYTDDAIARHGVLEPGHRIPAEAVHAPQSRSEGARGPRRGGVHRRIDAGVERPSGTDEAGVFCDRKRSGSGRGFGEVELKRRPSRGTGAARRSNERFETSPKRGPPARERKTIRLGIAGRRVALHSHLACLWETEDDFDEATGFVEAGLRGADHCVLLGDQRDIARFLSSLEGRGLDLEGLRAEGRLSIVERGATADEMLADIIARFEAASAEGAPVIRLLGNVGWGRVTGPPDAELASLEARLTPLARKYACVVLCLHEVRSLTGLTARYGLLRTHPEMLEEAGVLGNPFFVPFERFRDRLEAVKAQLSKGQNDREATRRQMEILQAIFDNIPVMISFVDPSGRVLLVNREWERVLGWTPQEAQGYDFLAEAYPDPEGRREVLEFVLKAEQRWQDFRTRTRDGRTIDTSWLRVVLSNGTRIGFGLDLTERKRLEKGIRTSEALLSEGERLAHTGSLVLTLGPGELFCSAEAFRIFGLEPGGKGSSPPFFGLQPADRPTVEARVHPADRSAIQTTFARAVAERKDFEFDYRVVRTDGTIRVVHSVGRPLLGESGEIREYVGVIMDVTEQALAREKPATFARRAALAVRETADRPRRGGSAHRAARCTTRSDRP